MISIASVRASSSIVVDRSGCSNVNAIGAAASTIARTNRCHAGRLEPSTDARTSNSPSLASSEGWKVNSPIPIHLRAPFTVTPAVCTAPRRSTAAA
jgi:hypothetical protein